MTPADQVAAYLIYGTLTCLLLTALGVLAAADTHTRARRGRTRPSWARGRARAAHYTRTRTRSSNTP